MGSSRARNGRSGQGSGKSSGIVGFYGPKEASRLCGTLECRQSVVEVSERGGRYRMRLPAGASPRVPVEVRASGGNLDELKTNFLAALAPHLSPATG